ncbi:hypothetical protein SESBI_08057 [Sesbania bispinosa]|nr:hypothetical protein SESBI_08057 [Sesbania bispinosa]
MRDLRGRSGQDGTGIEVAEAKREAMEAVVVGVPEVEARGSVPCQQVSEAAAPEDEEAACVVAVKRGCLVSGTHSTSSLGV